MAFVLIFAFLLSYSLLAFQEDFNIWIALSGSFVLALLGWMDDIEPLGVKVRLAVHSLVALWAIFWVKDSLTDPDSLATAFACVFFVFWIMWMINLYNFMDGIDGVAGSEALVVLFFGGFILLAGGDVPLALLCLTLACAVGGFLVFNWPPAKIFMGDSGSCFLGYVLAVMAIVSNGRGTMPFAGWLILLAVFIVDATLTLVRRVLRTEELFKAHRSHIYQKAVIRGYSHKTVTLWITRINVCLGMVLLIALWQDMIIPAFMGVYLVMIIAWLALDRKLSPQEALSDD
ncbi:MAG: glycosyltransferase family 4 protein [Synergistales bacterium]|nr:glycosyltransferase family 4 protein [Synergistales bacterium]